MGDTTKLKNLLVQAQEEGIRLSKITKLYDREPVMKEKEKLRFLQSVVELYIKLNLTMTEIWLDYLMLDNNEAEEFIVNFKVGLANYINE